MKLAMILTALSFTVVSHAEGKEGKVKAPHCRTIAEVCKNAGFKAGDWKNGDGLFVHCINPILGKPVNPKAPPLKAGLTVPTVAAADVQACNSESPNFGKGNSKKK